MGSVRAEFRRESVLGTQVRDSVSCNDVARFSGKVPGFGVLRPIIAREATLKFRPCHVSTANKVPGLVPNNTESP